MRCVEVAAIIVVLADVGCVAQNTQATASGRSSSVTLTVMPKSLEVRYALSALPPLLRMEQRLIAGSVCEYVLNHQGQTA